MKGYQAPKKTGSLLNDDTDLIKMVQEMHQIIEIR